MSPRGLPLPGELRVRPRPDGARHRPDSSSTARSSRSTPRASRPRTATGSLTIASIIQREARTRPTTATRCRGSSRTGSTPATRMTHSQMDSTAQYGYGDRAGLGRSARRSSSSDRQRVQHLHARRACRSARSRTPATSRSTRRMHPADGPWLYFVTVNLDTGETVFSRHVRRAPGSYVDQLARVVPRDPTTRRADRARARPRGARAIADRALAGRRSCTRRRTTCSGCDVALRARRGRRPAHLPEFFGGLDATSGAASSLTMPLKARGAACSRRHTATAAPSSPAPSTRVLLDRKGPRGFNTDIARHRAARSPSEGITDDVDTRPHHRHRQHGHLRVRRPLRARRLARCDVVARAARGGSPRSSASVDRLGGAHRVGGSTAPRCPCAATSSSTRCRATSTPMTSPDALAPPASLLLEVPYARRGPRRARHAWTARTPSA